MLSRVLVGRVLLAVGAVGVVASLVGMVVGWRLLSEVHAALDRSLLLTSDALDALDNSVAVAQDTAVVVTDGLEQTEQTARELVVVFADGQDILDATADMSERDIAASLEAVEEALPALIQVAEVMDRTLTAVSALPLGPTYDPDEPFDESLRAVQREMRGLPDELREQADLIRDAGRNLGTVGDGAASMASDLATLRVSMREAAGLLEGYADTAAEASAVVTDTQENLAARMRGARLMVVVLGLTLLLGQVVPLAIGWFLLRPDAAGAWLATARGTREP